MAIRQKLLCTFLLRAFILIVCALEPALSAATKQSDCECGTRTFDQSKIVGGTQAQQGQFPWMAQLLLYEDDKSQGFYNCGGSVINSMYILTAAHCTEGLKAENAEIYLGGVESQDSNADIYYGAEFIPHPQYNETGNSENDICLIRLTAAIQFNENVNAICLAPASETADYNERDYTIAGWGDTQTNGSGSDYLLEAHVDELSNDECAKAWSPNEIYDTQLCAARDGKDTCQGDSGGPMFFQDEDTQLFQQDGIVSYGRDCADPDFPGVYTRVSMFRDFIADNTEDADQCGN